MPILKIRMIENFELCEFVDKLKLHALINSGLLKEEWTETDMKKKYKWFNTHHYKGEIETLLNYYNNLDENGMVKIIYTKNEIQGRHKLPNCLSLMKRIYRNYLLIETYYDFDMVNSCATILLYLGLKHNSKNLRCLKLYVNNRQKWFNKIKKEFKCDDKKAKEIMTSITFGANLTFKDDELTAYKNSLLLIQNELKETHLYDYIETQKSGLSWLAKLVQTIEDEIVFNLIKHVELNYPQLTYNKFCDTSNAIYELDGFKLSKENVDNFGGPDAVIGIINEWLIENSYNSISFINKSMDEKIDLERVAICETDNVDIESVAICETERPSPITITQTFSPIIIETQQPPLPILEQTDYEERNDERVARTFLKFYRDLFIYEMESHKTYFYNGVYWEQDEYKIRKYLCENLLKKYQKQYDTLYDEGKKISMNDEVEYKRHQWLLKQIANFIDSLSTISYLKNYEEMIKTLIARKVEFDVNPYLFAFDNVIWDLRQGKIIEPHPSQMISMTTGYNFEFMPIDTLNEKKQTLMNVLKEIFPDDDIREYDLIVKSSGLTGIQVQNLIVSSGVGGNGKSIFNALMMKSLGNYGYNLSSTCLVQEIKTGPNPEFANLHNKRYVVSGEPPSKKYINMDTIKKLTGDPILEVRGLYQSKCETKLKCTLDLDLNGLPKFDVVDEAVNRRLRAIPFESRFVDESRYELLKDKPNVFKMNPIYKEEEFKTEYRQILFMILMDYLPKFLETGLLPNPPEKCKKLSNTMLANSDDLFDWFSNTFERNDDSVLSFGDIYDTYKTSSYFTNLSKKSQREQNRSKFITMIENNLFLKDNIKRRNQKHNGKQLTKDVLVGWILKKDDADDEEN